MLLNISIISDPILQHLNLFTFLLYIAVHYHNFVVHSSFTTHCFSVGLMMSYIDSIMESKKDIICHFFTG